MAISPEASSPSALAKLELRCPPLPETLLEALSLSKRPDDVTPASVTAVLQKDPLAVVGLLQMANSSLHGLRRAISSPERAVVMLGPMQVLGLVVGMGMLRLRSALNGTAGPTFNRLIRHSVATAHLARFLTEGLPTQLGQRKSALAGLGYTAGLLHDFGKIILVYNFPDQAVALYDQYGFGRGTNATVLQEHEHRLFGCDHTTAGNYAAQELDLPEPLSQAIRHHHHPELAPGEADDRHLVAAIALADVAARSLGHAFTLPCTWEEGAAHEAWAYYLPFAPASVETPEALAEIVRAEQEQLDHSVQSFATSMAG